MTIAKLDDKELLQSIDNLVNSVKEKSNEMAGHFDNALDRMKRSWRSAMDEMSGSQMSVTVKGDGATMKGSLDTGKIKKSVDDTNSSLEGYKNTLDAARDKQAGFVATEGELISTFQQKKAAVKEYDQQLKNLGIELDALTSRQKSLASSNVSSKGTEELVRKQEELNTKLQETQTKLSRIQKVREEAGKTIADFRQKWGAGDTFDKRFEAQEEAMRATADKIDKKWNEYWKKQEENAHKFAEVLKKSFEKIDFSDFQKKASGQYAELAKSWLAVKTNQDNTFLDSAFDKRGVLTERISSLRSYGDRATDAEKAELSVLEELKKKVLDYHKAKIKALSADENPKSKAIRDEAENYYKAIAMLGVANRMRREAREEEKNLQTQIEQTGQTIKQQNQANQQKLNLESQIAAKSKEISETESKRADAAAQAGEAAKNARQAIQGRIGADKEVTKAQNDYNNALRESKSIESQTTPADNVGNKTKKTQEDTQAIKDNTAAKKENLTLDQQAAAKGIAAGVKPTVTVDVTANTNNIETLRQQLDTIEKEKARVLKENGPLFASGFDEQINNIKNRISEIQNGTTSVAAESNKITEATKQNNQELAKTKELVDANNKATEQGSKSVVMSYSQMQEALKKAMEDNTGIRGKFDEKELQEYMVLLRNFKAELARAENTKGGEQRASQIKNEIAVLEDIINKYKTILENINHVNERQGTIDVKKWIKDLGTVDDRYKQLVKYYNELEKSPKAQMTDALKMPTNNVDEMRSKMETLKTIMDSVKGTDLIPSGLFAKAEGEVKRLTDVIKNQPIKDAYKDAFQLPSYSVDEMRHKIESLNKVLADNKDKKILSDTEIAKAQSEISRLTDKVDNFAKKAPKDVFKDALRLPDRNVEEINTKIAAINDALGKVKGKGIVSETEIKRAESLIGGLQTKLDKFTGYYANKQIKIALSMPENGLDRAKEKLEALRNLANSYGDKGIVDDVLWNKLQAQIGRTEEQVRRFGQTSKEETRRLRIAFAEAMLMPTGSIDEIGIKLRRLVDVMHNQRGIEVISPSQVARGNKEIDDLIGKLRLADNIQKNIQSGGFRFQSAEEYNTKVQKLTEDLRLAAISVSELKGRLENLQAANGNIEQVRNKISSLISDIRTTSEMRIEYTKIGSPLADTMTGYIGNMKEQIRSLWSEYKGLQAALANESPIALQGELTNAVGRFDLIKRELQDVLYMENRVTAGMTQYSDEIQAAATRIREWLAANNQSNLYSTKDGANAGLSISTGYEGAMSIERQLLDFVQRRNAQLAETNQHLNLSLAVDNAIAETEARITAQKEQQNAADEKAASTSRAKSFADYENLAAAVAHANNVSVENVQIANTETASYNALSATLKQLKSAYDNLSASDRKTMNAEVLLMEMQSVQRAMKEIQAQASRPVDLNVVLNLPEKNLDDISYKIQMLRAYAQGINIETTAGEAELTRVNNLVSELSEKSKNLQKTTKQIAEEANRVKFDKISQMPTDNIKQVGQKIKELKQYISELKSQPVIDEKSLKQAETMFGKLIKQAEKLNSVQGTSKNANAALKMQENTLDEIAKKMQRIQAIRSNLNIDTQRTQIERLNTALANLRKRQDEVLNKNQQMIASNTALGRSWNYMKNRLAFYFTVGASTQFVKNLIEVRSQYEMNERALGILIDSAERGTQIFNELSQMALVSPYTLIELSTAAKQLTAYDVAAKDVVDTTRRLADMASAVGIPIERLTYALGQIKAYGYLNSRDARMFANAGIPLVKELADHYTRLEGHLVSTADIYDRIKKKAIDYNDVMQVMNEMTDEGGKFFDFQAKMSETLKVQLANLTLAWNNMLNDIGASSQGLLSGGIGLLKELFLQWQTLDRIIWDCVYVFGAAFVAQTALNLAIGKGVASIDTVILANKRRVAVELERKALTQKLTADEQRLLATRKMITAEDYRQVLSSKTLTKQQAMLLFVMKGRNKELATALIRMGVLTAAELKNITTAKLLGAAWKSLGISIKAVGASMLAALPMIAATSVIFGVVDAIQFYNNQAEKTEELNKNIANNAKEASNALNSFLKDSVNISNRMKAVQGSMSASDADKTWNALREQIELSGAAGGVFIAKLLEIEDVNKRIVEGFTVAESIHDAANALSGLNAEALQVSQDSWLNGLFGEGLAEDMEDYIEALQRGRKEGRNVASKYFAAGEYNEAMREIKDFADNAETVIRDRLGAGVKDGVQLKEAIERIKKEVIAANPQIKGEVKKWFDVELDRMMAEKFGNVYNSLSSLQSQFIEHIKHDSGAALRRLSDDVLDTSKQLDDEVLDAISKAWVKLKNELPPEAQDLISRLQKQFDQNPLSLRVLLLEAGEKQVRDAIQKDYDQHFIDNQIGEKPNRPKDVGTLWDYGGNYNTFAAAQKKHEAEMVEYNKKNAEWESKRAEYVAKYGEYNKKAGETRSQWSKRVNDEIKNAEKEEKAAQHAIDNLEKELSLEQRKTDARYQAAIADKNAAEERKKNAQAAYNYEKLYQEEKKKSGSKKDPILEALKLEVQLVEKLQGDYDKLTKAGASQADALATIRGAYSKTISQVNTQLSKFGLPQIDLSQLVTGKDPHKSLEHFKKTLDTLVKNGLMNVERAKEVEGVIEKFTLSAKTYDLDKITKGLNNELGRLKDEYELAISLDADPEMGNLFADMMGLDMDSLPRTVEEYADRYSKILNKFLKDKGSNLQFTGDELYGLTRDDMAEFQRMYEAGTLNEEWFNAIKKTYEDISGRRKKDLEDTEKWKNSLIEKYGDLQDKLTKIYKDNIKNQVGAVKAFGTPEQESEILRLQSRLELTDNPAELADINAKIAAIVKDITDKNPIALKIVKASNNEASSLEAKAYWEDFKNSDLYTMTFEDMANNSTRAIQLIIDKLNELKGSVKEDPASMKALVKSLEDAEKELNTRDPFGGVARSLKAMAEASVEVENAQKALWRAEVDVQQAQQEADDTEDLSPEEQAAAQEKLAAAIQRRKTAQENLTKAENKGKKAHENLKGSLQGITGELGNVKSLFDAVSSLFRAGGDDKTADAIDAISEGFSVMTTVIMGVVAAMILLEASQPWLLAIAATLSVIAGLAKFLSGNDNDKINSEIEESQNVVKRLENTYKNLENAATNAYGAMTSGAKKAMQANKQLQLAELKRQLQLEKSRDSKDRDEGKIADLEGQIIELRNEIANASQEIIDDLLGISSAGDGVTSLVDAMINAFKNGEDAMEAFGEKWDEMVDNMILKLIVSKYMSEAWDDIMANLKKKQDEYLKESSNKNVENQKEIDRINALTDDEIAHEIAESLGYGKEGTYTNPEQLYDLIKRGSVNVEHFGHGGNYWSYYWIEGWQQVTDEQIAEYRKYLEQNLTDSQDKLNDASLSFTEWSLEYMKGEGRDIMMERALMLKEALSDWYTFGQDNDKNLSALQQGIQGITEDTAGALEAYMNGVSQQVYYHSTLLEEILAAILQIGGIDTLNPNVLEQVEAARQTNTSSLTPQTGDMPSFVQQIRDTLVGLPFEEQTGIQAQMLLQLQQSYQVQNSIRSMLEGWSNASGQAVRVELMN